MTKNYTPAPPAKLPEELRHWAREMRCKMTDAEALIWHLVRNRRILNAKFRRQHPVGRYILDFYCNEKKLAIELDGGQHAHSVDYDERRKAWLRTQGIQTLRIWNNQVLTETAAVMEAIYHALTATAPATSLTPAPLPPAGEGSSTRPTGQNNLVSGE